MSDKKIATAPAVIPETRDLLATVRDYYPDLSENQKHGLARWATFEELCSLPFIPKTAAADFGDAFLFTIMRVGEQTRVNEFVNKSTGEVQRTEQYVILVRVDTECDLPLRNVNKTIRFKKGDKAIVGYPSGHALRDGAVAVLRKGIEENGPLPGFFMEQLESNDPMLNGPIVLRCIFTGSEIIGDERPAIPA